MVALMLRYIDGHEEVAYQYARTLVRHFTVHRPVHDALLLVRDIVTEVTNDIEIFESEEVADRIDVALRRSARPRRGRADRLSHPPYPHNVIENIPGS